jgi:phospholipase/lecithinase/hemolysin
MQTCRVLRVRLTVCFLLFGLVALPTKAAFTSLYVFGDGACTTTNGPGGSLYYGKRFCNGRVWVEVLAQWQGLTYESNRNWSYYGHYSSNMIVNVSNSPAPPDAGTALYIVWACDADFVWNINNYGTNLVQWTNSINRTLSNYVTITTNLYAKGVRTMVMPNAVDLTKVPQFMNYAAANKAFIRQRTMDFNARFAVAVSNAMDSLPGLAIHSPDIFALLDNVAANPTNYGLIKPETCVICDLPPTQWDLNGPGTNYVFWDDLDPTAKFQMWIADAAQELLSPVRINKITSQNGVTNQLDLINVPIGRNGVVEGTTNFADWTVAGNVMSTNTLQSVSFSVSDPVPPAQFYRVRFPFVWTWP